MAPSCSQSVGTHYDLCDMLLPLHTFRADQQLVDGEIVKVFVPKGSHVSVNSSEDETPPHLHGLVKTRLVIQSPTLVEEHRELCVGEFLDEIVSVGGALMGGDLVQG